MTTLTRIEPVVKKLALKAPPAKAFRHFTENIHLWWPYATHSLSQNDTATVTFEAREGGRIFETDKNGREREWGRVKACEAPHRLVFSWVLEKPEIASEVEVIIEDDGAGGAAFTLIHRDWERAGKETRDGYNQGWIGVLDAFAKGL